MPYANKRAVFAVQALLLTLAILGQAYPEYSEYREIFNKSYSLEELPVRQEIYETRISHFSEMTEYQPNVNNMTDWTQEEIDQLKGIKNLSDFQRISSNLS